MRPIGIDLFAGAGGLSLGFEQAGFDIVGAVEIDPIHAATHKFNFPHCGVVARSVLDVSGDDIRKAANIGSCPVDVVFGGAPCQGFSLMGQRALDDPRNLLVREFVRLVSELSPSYFVFENVKGLTVGEHRKFLDKIIEAFEDCGYRVTMPWKVLNATWFGVPQDRQRLFILGAKDGLRLPSYPNAVTHAAGKTNGGLPAGPSCKEALGDLPEAEDFPNLLETDAVETGEWGEPSDYALCMRCLTDDAWGYGYPRKWNQRLLTASLRTGHTEISRRRFAETKQGEVESISRFYRLPADGVSNTLRAGTDSARGAFTSPRPIHFAKSRCITVREMARLHSFPDWFRFHVTKWHGARQVGNAVPPMLARAVAQKIMEAIGIAPTRPKIILDLGDPKLLQLGMSEASSFWGVLPPIAGRDRKSGARKRAQQDTEVEQRLAEDHCRG